MLFPQHSLHVTQTVALDSRSIIYLDYTLVYLIMSKKPIIVYTQIGRLLEL